MAHTHSHSHSPGDENAKRLMLAFGVTATFMVIEVIGGLISGASDAYTYLPDSVRKFPDAPGLAAKMSAAGFRDVSFERMTFGIVALHTGAV